MEKTETAELSVRSMGRKEALELLERMRHRAIEEAERADEQFREKLELERQEKEANDRARREYLRAQAAELRADEEAQS